MTRSRTSIQELWQVNRYSCFMINNLKFLDVKRLSQGHKILNDSESGSCFLHCWISQMTPQHWCCTNLWFLIIHLSGLLFHVCWDCPLRSSTPGKRAALLADAFNPYSNFSKKWTSKIFILNLLEKNHTILLLIWSATLRSWGHKDIPAWQTCLFISKRERVPGELKGTNSRHCRSLIQSQEYLLHGSAVITLPLGLDLAVGTMKFYTSIC